MFSRYSYVHIPMGVSWSSDCFQYKMDQIFGPIWQLLQHHQWLGNLQLLWRGPWLSIVQVLDTAKHVGLRFNPDKCIFKWTQIPFFDMLIGVYGIRPDPKKIEDLNFLPLPVNVREMQSFLGIVNYLSRFSPMIANLTGSLRPLVKKGNMYKAEKTPQNSIYDYY